MAEPMRVLHVVQELRRGGAETVVRALVSGLVERGLRAEVAAAPGPWAAAFGDVRVHPLPVVARRPHRLVGGTVALHRALRRARPDVVHCHNPTMALLAGLPTRRGRRPPALVTVHGVEADQYGRAAAMLRVAGLEVIACGPGVRNALWAAGAPVHDMILNGVPSPSPSLSRTAVRHELGLVATAPVLASVGRLVPLKRHDLAIRAVALLPEVQLLVVGAGPQHGALQRLADELGVRDRVVLTGPREDVSALLGAVDVLLLCSRGEGLPLTLLEALAAGAPVVAVDVPGVRETVTHGHDALLCGPTPESLAAGARRVIEDPGLAGRLRLTGLESVRPYSDRRMVEAYVGAYRRIIEGDLS